MKIMITGARGQLGADCNRVLSKGHEVMAAARNELDITNASSVDTRVKNFMPDIIVNCAAYTKVDECEKEKDSAWKINVTGPQNLALSVEKYGSLLIHVMGLPNSREKGPSKSPRIDL